MTMSTYHIDAPIGAAYDESGPVAARASYGRNALRRAWKFVQPGLQLLLRAMAESRRRQAERELQRLDDRMLHDIGIRRETIKYVVRYGRDFDGAAFAREWAASARTDPFQRE
jgi:uncharacterized protein YjiS (DUF1127 family)